MFEATLIDAVLQSREHARIFDPTRSMDRQDEINDILIFRAVVGPGACFQAASTDLPEESRQLLTNCRVDVETARFEMEEHCGATAALLKGLLK